MSETKSLKILRIKKWFPCNFSKILQGGHFVVGGSKSFKLLSDITLIAAFKRLHIKVYCCFRVFVLSLS